MIKTKNKKKIKKYNKGTSSAGFDTSKWMDNDWVNKSAGIKSGSTNLSSSFSTPQIDTGSVDALGYKIGLSTGNSLMTSNALSKVKGNGLPPTGKNINYGSITNSALDAYSRILDGKVDAEDALYLAQDVAGIGGALGSSALGAAAGPLGVATGVLSMGKNAVNSIETGVVDPLGGAAQGAAVGSMIAPGIGTAIGAGVGAVASSIGTPGSVDQQGNITYANGLNGLFGFGHSKGYLRGIARSTKQGIANQAASQRLRAQDTYEGVSLAADGGILPTTLAYLDDGELIRTPDGTISEIPEEGKPTDSNLVDVPVGTQVLSDKMKVPGTKKTFAEAGKEIMKVKKYNKDKYAENSKKLNDINNLLAYNELLSLQESRKKRHTETKDGLPEAQNGSAGLESALRVRNPYYRLSPTSTADKTVVLRIVENDLLYNNPQYSAERWINLFKDGDAINSGLINAGWSHGTDANALLNNYHTLVPSTVKYNPKSTKVSTQLSGIIKLSNNELDNAFVADLNIINSLINSSPIIPTLPTQTTLLDKIESPTSLVRNPISKNHPVDYRLVDYTPKELKQPKNKNRKFDIDYGDLANLAGAMLNYVNPDPVDLYTYEPTYGPTTYNINPILDEINASNAIAKYNASKVSPTTGAGMALNIAASVARNRAISSAYAQKGNIENQLAMQNAAIANARNQYTAEARHRQADEYARNKGVADTANSRIRNNKYSILANMSRDKKLSARDQALLEYMKPFLSNGYFTK